MKSSLGICLLILILPTLALSADKERFAVGYDRGISLRYSLIDNLSLSIIGNAGSSYYGGSQFYSDEKMERMQYYDENNKYHYNRDSKCKVFGVFGRVAYQIDLTKRLSASPYLQIGGTYGKSYYNSEDWEGDDKPANLQINKSHTKRTSIAGEIGIMPGFTYKRLTIQFGLGIGAEIINTKPQSGSNDIEDGKTKKAYLVYPSDLLNSLSIHLWLF